MNLRFVRIWIYSVLFLLVAQWPWANNAKEFFNGLKNFWEVTNLVDQKFEKEVDLAKLYEEAWSYFYKQSWDDVKKVIPNADEILAATVTPGSASEEIRNFYSSRINETLTQFAKVQVENATPTVQDLWNNSTTGLVVALGDVYSQYLAPQEHQKLQDSLSGKPDEAKVFYGVGISVEWDTQSDAGVLVVSPIPGSPAEKNNVQAGDVIIGVEGLFFKEWKEVPAKKLEKAINLIKGEKDSKVDLIIKKPKVAEPVHVILSRAPINPEQLISKEMLDDNVGLIRLVSFYANAADDLKEAMRYLKLSGMKKMILDLRFNTGGYLDQAVKVGELFLKKGDLITYTYGRSSPYRYFYDETADEEGFSDIPLVVLVNQYSASASEVVTGALKDNKRAVVVGKTSFGKGSVQEVFPLKNNAGLRLTVAHYYSPSKVCIHGIGIKPDLDVNPITEEQWEKVKDKEYTHVSRLDRIFDRDPQLKAAYQVEKGEIRINEIKRLSDIQKESEKNQISAKADIKTDTAETE